MNAQHSSIKQEHYTPEDIVEAARATMGSIDLDPASCEKANRIIKAKTFYTRAESGLQQRWFGNVFLNPPGGRENEPTPEHTKGTGRFNSTLWWPHLAQQWVIGNVEQAIFVGFSIEILQSSQGADGVPIPLDFPFCIPAARICFLNEDLRLQKDPTHANVIVYLPQKDQAAMRLLAFRKYFSAFGRVTVPARV